MKRNFLNLASALSLGACLTALNVDAQSTNSRQSNTPAKSNSSYGKSQSTTMSKGSDQMFIQKAMEADKAEIELGKMALQKASSDKVKEYAQMMIDEHTANSSQLAATVSGMAAGNTSDGMGTMGNDNAGTASGSGSMGTSGSSSSGSSTSGSGTSATGATSGSGNTSGSMSSGTSDSGSTSGTMNSGTGTSDTSTQGTSGTTGTSGSGSAGTSGTTGSATSGTTGNSNSSSSGNMSSGNTDATSSNPSSGMGNTSGMGTTGSRVGQTAADMGNPGTSGMLADVELSPEHRALSDRLANLSGAEFDKEYVQAQLKDHDKSIALYENQAKNGKDAQTKEFAKMMLPNLRKHKQMAMDLSTSMRTGKSSGSMNHSNH